MSILLMIGIYIHVGKRIQEAQQAQIEQEEPEEPDHSVIINVKPAATHKHAIHPHILHQMLEDATKLARTYDCPICLEKGFTPEKIMLTGCGHAFCKACFPKYIEAAEACPVCRAEL